MMLMEAAEFLEIHYLELLQLKKEGRILTTRTDAGQHEYNVIDLCELKNQLKKEKQNG